MNDSTASIENSRASTGHYYLMLLIDKYHLSPQDIAKRARIQLVTIYRLIHNPVYEVTFPTFRRLLALYAVMITPVTDLNTNLLNTGTF